MDIVKHLERAQRYVEKNKLDDAIGVLESVLGEVPNHLETLQALGDLYARQNRLEDAAVCYGRLFDRFVDPRDEHKALAIYSRFLKPTQQPPERVARYALLLQKQNRADEAIDQFTAAAMAFELSNKPDDALACFVRITELDADNPDRHVALAELAERQGKESVAAKAYLRAGQLATGARDAARANDLLARAHKLAPAERSVALLYAQSLIGKGDPTAAAALLEPLSGSEHDAAFLETLAEALTRSAQLDRAYTVLQRAAKDKAVSPVRFFVLASEFLRTGQDEKAASLLGVLKKQMIGSKKEGEFTAAADQLAAAYPQSIRLAEFIGGLYSELNRETKYFEVLVRLFDLCLAANQSPRACETLERLVDIDPYDSLHQQRLERLQGRADDRVLTRLKNRLQQSATHAAPQTSTRGAVRGGSMQSSQPQSESGRATQTLDDLLVQAEIFIQYSLQSKAIERLQKIAEMFPGEEERNERLRNLYEAAHWWPKSSAAESKPEPIRVAAEPATRTGSYSPETLRDLAKISEINQNIFRQPSPRAMLSAAVNDIGSYLNLTRCLAVVGGAGQPPQIASEFCAPGSEPSTGSQIVRLISQIERETPDALGGISLQAESHPLLSEMKLDTALGVLLMDRDTQSRAGILIASHAEPHKWRPNESFFLQSIGDQMLLGVHHTRLRTLVRTMAVADEKTGLMARSSYQDCLLRETQRARMQSTPLALALLQLDHGPELLRQQGEAPLERHMEQVARALQPAMRQSDLAIKYTAWALAFVLPDTPLPGARFLAEKVRKMVSKLRPPWDGKSATMSLVVAEAVVRPEFENEDIVTELINRAEASLEETRKRGGDTILSPDPAQV